MILSLLACRTTFGAQGLDYTIHQQYVSTRALGMGNAYTAAVTDSSAIFYNPAALARRTDSELHMEIQATMDKDFPSFVSDIQKDSKLSTTADKVTAYTQLLLKDYGKDYFVRAPGLGTLYARPHWGFAFIPADIDINMGVHRDVGPTLNVLGYADTTLAMSYAHDINGLGTDNELSVGMTAKVMHRIQVNTLLLATDLAAGSKIYDTKNAQEGLTADFDVGTLFTPGLPQSGFFKFLNYVKPSFAFVVRNVLNEGYFSNFHFINKNSKKPDKTGRRYDFGTVYELPSFWVFKPRLAADLRDVGDPNWTVKKGYHIGAEFYWTMYNWWKGHWSVGVNQGYLAAGFGGKLGIFNLEIATVGEEVGTPSAPQENRRYMVELALDF